MSIDKQHYQARQSYVDAMKQAALRDAERERAFRDKCLAILNRQAVRGSGTASGIACTGSPESV